MEINQIKPKGKKSDKYSTNLYKYLNRHPSYCNVYYQAMHTIKIECERDTNKPKEWQQQEFKIDNFNINDIYLSCYPEWYIEKDGLLTGRSLISILRGGRGMYENFAISSSMPRKYIDITELFWSEYIKIGRCIWDKSHNGWLQDDKDRFTYIDKDNRKCNWCGEIQHKETKEETFVQKNEIWVKG